MASLTRMIAQKSVWASVSSRSGGSVVDGSARISINHYHRALYKCCFSSTNTSSTSNTTSSIRNPSLATPAFTAVQGKTVTILGHNRSPVNHQHHHLQQQQQRWYTPLAADEEQQEKERVLELSEFAKDQELRKLNREIARLEMLRGINTGELYTWSGRYKVLARDYGMPLVAWYWACWTSTALLCYGAITVFNVDTVALLAQIDAKTGWALVDKIDPRWGKIGMAIVINEVIEPLRLPLVILTVKPVMDRIAPPKF